MSKMVAVLTVAAIAALVLGGVLEIKFHPERLSQTPATLRRVTQDQTLFEKGRAQVVSLKRQGEQLMVRDTNRKLELAVLYVKEDAQRLQNLAQGHNVNPEILLPQAKLLLSSIEQVRAQAQDAPVKVVAELKEESREAFTLAYEAYARISQLREEYGTLQKEFLRLTGSLEEQIGGLAEQNKKEETVAGTRDEDEQAEQSKIPLKF